jgi:hypothetical protein
MISKDSIVNANGAVTSATNFFISSGAIDFSLPIGFGESVSFNFNNPPSGQGLTTVGLLPFGGSAGQRVSLVIEDLTCDASLRQAQRRERPFANLLSQPQPDAAKPHRLAARE